MNCPLLEARDVSVRYSGILALEKFSLTIAANEIVAIVGANGAGKSTFLRAITGLVPIAGGDVLLDGKSIAQLGPHEIVCAGVGHCPEGRRVFSRLTVSDNLKLGGYILKSNRELSAQMDSMLTLFPRLSERIDQLAGSMSGGEQQMLALARALMSRPKILLLDEPSLGLAPQIVDEIFEIIQGLRKVGTAILLVEQNAVLALEVSDRAYVLEAGHMADGGDAKDLLGNDRIRAAYLGY